MDIASVISFVRLAAQATAKCGQHALYFKQNSVIGYSPIFEKNASIAKNICLTSKEA